MKIGYDISQTGTEKAGCGFMADSLIDALTSIDQRNSYLLYPTFGDRYWDPAGPDATRRFAHANVRVGLIHETPAAAQAFWRHPPADLERQLGNPDLVHANNFFCPPGLRHARLVYTLYDLSFLSHPSWTTEHNRQVCFDGVFRASFEADLVLAISDFSRQHFLRTFPHYPEARTRVVHLASRFTPDAPAQRPDRSTAPRLKTDHFFLFVGTLEPRKNPSRLLRAYAAYVRQCDGTPTPLVLAGGQGWLTDDWRRDVQESGADEWVHHLGYADDAELAWLYRHCRAFVYPSLFEGFGLPVVEALSQGAAVVTSSVSALPEVIGDAGALVDPRDESQLTRALIRLDHDTNLRQQLRAGAKAQASRFSWPRAADAVLGHYRDVLAMEKYRSMA